MILLGLILAVSACTNNSKKEIVLEENIETKGKEKNWTKDEQEVKAVVEQFRMIAAKSDQAAINEMILEEANIGISRYKDGKWQDSDITITEYYEDHKLRPYYDPVDEWTIKIHEGPTAIVKAYAVLYAYGVPMMRNVDHFRLIRKNGAWKFLNLFFTTKPLPEDKKKYDLEVFAKSYAQAWSSLQPEFVALYFAEDGLLQVNNEAPAKGRTEILKIAQGFMTDLPDMVVRFDSLVTNSTGTEFHWTLTATNSGPGGKGNKVKVGGFELWQIGDNGLIKKSHGNFPSEEYNHQLEFGIDN